MSYYTDFDLYVSDEWVDRQVPLDTMVTEAHIFPDDVKARLVTKTVEVIPAVIDFLQEKHGGSWTGVFDDPLNWRSYAADMKEVSTTFPEVLFRLEGEGEHRGDLWKMYFKDGKLQDCHAVITYPEFDEEKLV